MLFVCGCLCSFFSFLALRFPSEAIGHFFAEPRLLQRWDQAFGGTIFKKRIIVSRKKSNDIQNMNIHWYLALYICRNLLLATKYKNHCLFFFVLVLCYAILVWEKWCETGVLCSSVIWNIFILIFLKYLHTSWKHILVGSHRFIYFLLIIFY